MCAAERDARENATRERRLAQIQQNKERDDFASKPTTGCVWSLFKNVVVVLYKTLDFLLIVMNNLGRL